MVNIIKNDCNVSRGNDFAQSDSSFRAKIPFCFVTIYLAQKVAYFIVKVGSKTIVLLSLNLNSIVNVGNEKV